jgi:TDG/mug DNA glycosylase family protein
MSDRRPSRAELQAATSLTIPDLIAPKLKVLFCGINPGLYSAATGHHFARPGNRFWPALHESGFTERRLAPWEEHLFLQQGYGITNLVPRTTASAAELEAAELIAGGRQLERKLRRHAPQWVAILGISAYRIAFDRKAAVVGRQPAALGSSRLWLLPSPSGLNANHPPRELVRAFRDLRQAIETDFTS